MRDNLDWLGDIRCFVLDMDGTFYLENTIYPFSLDFLRKLEDSGRSFLFLTNNSSRTDRDYIEKLAAMGCPITDRQILTSGDVTIAFLKKYYAGKTIYLLGTPALEEDFREAGILLWNDRAPEGEEAADRDRSGRESAGGAENAWVQGIHIPHAVVVAFDKTLNYEKLTNACTCIRRGSDFLATHPDINCPMQDGFIPDCGAFCAAISLSTGRQPRYLGKPMPETLEMVTDITGFAPEQVLFIGDRLYTDVATGVKNGAYGALVLSGEATLADVEDSEVKPDAVFRDLEELGEYL